MCEPRRWSATACIAIISCMYWGMIRTWECYSCSGSGDDCKGAYEYHKKTCDVGTTTCTTIRHYNMAINLKMYVRDKVHYARDCGKGYFSRVWIDAQMRTRSLVEAEIAICGSSLCNGQGEPYTTPNITFPERFNESSLTTTTAKP
ncbi:uncharacterized protein LOC129600462 [Paramacrobiotus metropolitanus]|uniref:uncharacterized protein LOC129600462 n=1 Tax=Paramacrobiotus metropolitanus TaxID=2943436 RepID=UPI0024461916|nr:uncharacterized protein LOC129600462 [Paramacrobiotus metropolitanus]